jgi:hypothetical protein
MPIDSATGATPKLCAMAGTAVVMTVASRFSMKNAAATRKAMRRPCGGSTADAAGAGVAEVMGLPSIATLGRLRRNPCACLKRLHQSRRRAIGQRGRRGE